MRRLTKAVACAGVVVAAGCIAPQAEAAVYSGVTYWSTPSGPGAAAATCSITLPDEQPLAVPRTLVVGNDIPNGTEIFSWGYGEWSSDVVLSCVSSGIYGSSTAIAGFNPEITFNVANSYDSAGNVLLTDTGLRLKVWVKAGTSSTPCSGTGCNNTDNEYSFYATGSSYSFSVVGEETSMSDYAGLNYAYQKIGTPFIIGVGRYYPTITGRYSIRASIIKVGNVSYGPLSVSGTLPYFYSNSLGGNVNTLFQGSGITIAPPACQLRTTDYTIPMGRWAADAITYVGTPAYGSQVPVNLSLECSGRVNHVRFRFEDTGTSLSGNKNISLYDTAGGNKIDGLEIELFYNGTKVNVDNTTVTDTGSHGSFVSVSAAFDSVSTAAFQARYVQNAAVTRAGANYTGPVTGKVNMYVTYD